MSLNSAVASFYLILLRIKRLAFFGYFWNSMLAKLQLNKNNEKKKKNSENNLIVFDKNMIRFKFEIETPKERKN